MNQLGLIQCTKRRTKYFKLRSLLSLIQDDHLPFLRKSVPIIHLIPNPFPKVWHQPDDTEDQLSHSTINNLQKILIMFVMEYLHLNT